MHAAQSGLTSVCAEPVCLSTSALLRRPECLGCYFAVVLPLLDIPTFCFSHDSDCHHVQLMHKTNHLSRVVSVVRPLSAYTCLQTPMHPSTQTRARTHARTRTRARANERSCNHEFTLALARAQSFAQSRPCTYHSYMQL